MPSSALSPPARYPLALTVLLLASLPALAARNAIVELDCRHPAAGAAPGLATASARFVSAEREEAVSVVLAPTAAALQKALGAPGAPRYERVADDHYASRDGRHSLRQVGAQPLGPPGQACDEAVAALVARFDQQAPADPRALPSVELHLLDGLSRHRWDLVDRQFVDRSSPNQVRTSVTYYLRRPD